MKQKILIPIYKSDTWSFFCWNVLNVSHVCRIRKFKGYLQVNRQKRWISIFTCLSELIVYKIRFILLQLLIRKKNIRLNKSMTFENDKNQLGKKTAIFFHKNDIYKFNRTLNCDIQRRNAFLGIDLVKFNFALKRIWYFKVW